MTLADKIVVLKEGEVMQVGAPMELFNNPANEFVAGFLGSPAINFFDGRLTDLSEDCVTAAFKGEGLSLSDTRLVNKEKKKGDAVRVGVRPQHLFIDPDGGLNGEITLIERLGTETVVELEIFW